jgi:Cu(I)/Ag(I) efflux system membrane fusion protein
MHPAGVRDNGKEKCPVCFMPLSKRKKGEAHEEVLPAGIVNRLQLSPYRIVLAGVQTWSLDYLPASKEIKAAGYIEFNERGQRTVSARIAGRIDKLSVNETGQMVKEGDELASIYSPDLVVTVQNLLDAKRSGNSNNQERAVGNRRCSNPGNRRRE